MKIIEIKTKIKEANYSIFLGKNILGILKNKIKITCPNTSKIALIIDGKIPLKFKQQLKKNLFGYELYFYTFHSTEKNKTLKYSQNIIEQLLINKFSRADLIIGIGGGIVGDVSGFIASILKRGINFINVPTTLLAQVDSSIGGKTGVNSEHGKNLIGSFYQPRMVVIDISFLQSLPRREMVCGHAEIIKHALIKDANFFKWLKKNTNKIIHLKDLYSLIFAIKKSCKIKLSFVEKDLKEKGLRMALNFGHTFAHAIEACDKYSGKINHGEAVLIGMMIATKISVIKKVCKNNVLSEIKDIYKTNKLNYNLKSVFKNNQINKIFSFIRNDKKNNDNKINLILLRKIGKTTTPGKFKFTLKDLKAIFKKII